MKWLRSIFSPPDARTPPHRFVVEGLTKRLRSAPVYFENYHPQGSPGPIYTQFRLTNNTTNRPRTIGIDVRNASATVKFNDTVALSLVLASDTPFAELEEIVCTIEKIQSDHLVVLTRGIMTGEPYGCVPLIDCRMLQSAEEAAISHCQQVFPRETPFASLTSWTGKNDRQFKPPKVSFLTPPQSSHSPRHQTPPRSSP